MLYYKVLVQVFIGLSLLFLGTGCVKNELVEYGNTFFLEFTCEEENESFDKNIRNNVHLHIYQEEKLEEVRVISFEEIRNGQLYPIDNYQSGRTNLIAWAVPAGADEENVIPEGIPGLNKKEKRIRLTPVGESGREFLPSSVLYSERYTLSSGRNDIPEVLTLSLKPCVCRLSVSIESPLMVTRKDQPSIRVYGTRSEMDLDFNPLGKEAIISGLFHTDATSQNWNSGEIGLLPSAGTERLSMEISMGNRYSFFIHTNYQSQPGDLVQVKIAEDESGAISQVRLFINGWETNHFTLN